MLNDQPVRPTIAASDLDRARRFYQDTLGLKIADERGEGIVFESGETTLLVYQSAFAGTSQATVAGWMVSDLEGTMADLRSRGVTFEEYDMPGLKTVDGVAENDAMRGAWFKDTEGNILAVAEEKQG
ncbi:MAG: VOC family protein [Catenulispora sp.]|nr:VOC family protein [Catenulispora sp.]